MAKGHGRKRRRFNLRRVRVNILVAAGALATLDVVGATITQSAGNAYRLMSVDFAYSMVDIGATQDDGQVFGLAHSDYTDAEIEECLEATTAIDPGDKIAQERANRLVREIGQMQGAPGTGAGKSFNNGMPLKTKLNWHMATGDTLRLWIRNSSGTVWTTGASVSVSGNVWLKDAV